MIHASDPKLPSAELPNRTRFCRLTERAAEVKILQKNPILVFRLARTDKFKQFGSVRELSICATRPLPPSDVVQPPAPSATTSSQLFGQGKHMATAEDITSLDQEVVRLSGAGKYAEAAPARRASAGSGRTSAWPKSYKTLWPSSAGSFAALDSWGLDGQHSIGSKISSTNALTPFDFNTSANASQTT